jgi:hypothetical protein
LSAKKLWLFAHNVQMEHTSKAVQIGAKVHKDSYKKNYGVRALPAFKT